MKKSDPNNEMPQLVPNRKTQGDPNPSPGSLATPPAIAYKIPASKFASLLTPILLPSDNPQIKNTRELIGLQIQFRTEVVDANGDSSWPLLSHLKFAQVYFNSHPGPGNPYFERLDDFEGNQIQLTLEETYTVTLHEDTESGEEWSSLEQFVPPPQTETICIYKKLDFYQGIGFVYFSAGQLRFLTHFYNELIISGCRYEIGRKLHHPDLSAPVTDKIFPEGSFSLKIEGGAPSSNVRVYPVIDSAARARGILEATEGADIAIGHPCPPKWESFLAATGDIIGNNPALLVITPGLWADWNTYVVHVSGGEEPVDDQN